MGNRVEWVSLINEVKTKISYILRKKNAILIVFPLCICSHYDVSHLTFLNDSIILSKRFAHKI